MASSSYPSASSSNRSLGWYCALGAAYAAAIGAVGWVILDPWGPAAAASAVAAGLTAPLIARRYV